MAIKGKRKPKARSGRVVTSGPRPAYVRPKVPLFQRTGAKFLVALIIEAALFALVIGFGEESEADRERRQIGEFTSLVEASLNSAGPAIQPLPAGALVLPELGTRLTELQGEEPPSADEIETQAEDWTSGLSRAADRLAQLQVPQEHLEPAQLLALTEARNAMERGLRVYVGLVAQLAVAVQIEGDARDELLTSIQQQMAVASSIFDGGYGKLQEVRRQVELPTTGSVPGGGFPPGSAPGGGFPPAGVPGGGFPPGGVPEIPTEQIPVEPVGGGGGGGGGQGGGGGNDAEGGG
jgi:hypothetical protein